MSYILSFLIILTLLFLPIIMRHKSQNKMIENKKYYDLFIKSPTIAGINMIGEFNAFTYDILMHYFDM